LTATPLFVAPTFVPVVNEQLFTLVGKICALHGVLFVGVDIDPLTVTVTLVVFVHPPASVTNTVYVVVALGDAIGFQTLLLDNPVDGDQL
jgi:hypothetical protein